MNGRIVFESDRLFSLFGYSMSHTCFCLDAGNRTKTPSSGVDVLFQDLRAVEIRAWFKGIKVEETDDLGLLDGQRSKPTDMIEPGNRWTLG